jgi:hypothetical protein
MAVYFLAAAPIWTPIGTGPLLMSVRQSPVEVFANSVPGTSDEGIQFQTGDNLRVPLPSTAGTVYARPFGVGASAVVISFIASS